MAERLGRGEYGRAGQIRSVRRKRRPCDVRARMDGWLAANAALYLAASGAGGQLGQVRAAVATNDLFMTDSTKRICLWSGPRNISTALMYSFSQRSDTTAVDEPLYAHFLRVSGAQHPLREACMAAQDSDGNRVARESILGPWNSPVVFFKQMAHHLVDLDLDFMRSTCNVFLTRDPREVLPSLLLRIGQPRMRDTGFARQCELMAMLENWGQVPAVLDSRDLLSDPPGALAALCRHLEIPFEEEMLLWPAGPKEFDGVWAPEWYKNVHQSTGFRPYLPKSEPFPESLRPLLEECVPYYAKLQERALRP